MRAQTIANALICLMRISWQEPLLFPEPSKSGPKARLRRCHVSDAALHDNPALDHLLLRGNTGAGVWADTAYRSEEMETKLQVAKLTSHIHREGERVKPPTDRAKGSNRVKSTVGGRVERIIGARGRPDRRVFHPG